MLDWHECEMHLLSIFARVARTGVDRRPDEMVQVDQGTGLPLSANDLRPTYAAITGRKLALDYVVVPRNLASAILGRSQRTPDGVEERVALAFIPPAEWSRPEREAVDALEERLKLTAARLADRHGWFNLQPLGGNIYDPDELMPLDDHGLPMALQITYAGLDEALRRVRGTKWERGPRSLKDEVGSEKWAKAPQWAQQLARHL